jgi:serine/threonine-protein kinase
MFSPDGRALAWVSTETGRPQVYLRAYPTGERILVSSEGGTEPVWSRAGTELFYRHGQEFLSVAVRTKGIVTVGRPSVLFRGDFLVGSITPGVPGYDVAPDGQRFLVVVRATEAARPARIDVVTNWLEELAAKLPTGREQ